jgi:PAS domain S-box-containing protein
MASRRTQRAQPKCDRPEPRRAGPTDGGRRGGPEGGDTAARDRAALAGALDPIITIDAVGTIQSASDSVERVFGWSPAELRGRNVRVLMPEPNRSAHDGYLARYRETGQTNILNRTRRFEAVRKDGTVFPIELSVSRANTPGHALFVGIIRDASAQAAAEQSAENQRFRLQTQVTEQTEALEAAHLRLRMSDRLASIGTLAAGLGHDMNNVLLPVRAHLNALRAESAAGHLSEGASRHVESIRKSISYLQQLADGLHFLAMDPEKEETGTPEELDLGAWWAHTGPLIAKAVPKHVRVTASFPVDLPRVRVGGPGLTQAVLNLVVNAGEAIPAGRRRRQGRVRVGAVAGADAGGARCVRLSVTDNGVGMSEEVQRRAFEMFFTTKPRGLGTGLGLALVRKVADRAEGSVEIESEPGQGTTVTLVLPGAGRALPAEGDGTARPVVVVSVTDGRRAALLRHVLEATGARVESGGKPGEAQVWVVEPGAGRRREVEAWRVKKPRGRLVLFGAPDPGSAAAWNAFGPIIIEDRDDFEAARAALGRALAEL